MKFTLSWLKDHLDTTAGIAEIVEAMTMAGLEVEQVVDSAAALAQFSVARIVSVAQHPNADKLQVCQVDTRDGPKEIVCGALNARAGLVTAYAPIGAYIPGTGITLEPKPVRGVVSHGMLCSETETQTADDPFALRTARFEIWKARAVALGMDEAKARADGGIMELPDDALVGTALAELLGLDDPVVDFEVTPNRPDWLGVAGIARDLAATGVGKLKTQSVKPVPGAFDSPIRVEIDDSGACPIFAATMIRGVKNGPSPAWLQARLRAIGIKPRNILVDITNYLSYDRARPLHVYDASSLSGTVRARLGREGETLKALDGKTYAVTPAMCVIADDQQVLGLGGVMGGEHSGSSDQTTDVVVESAWFDPHRTFKTGRATGITSDAQYRFARGVDPGFVIEGLHAAVRMIMDLAGGEASRPVIAGAAPAPPHGVAFDPDRVQKLAGLDVKPARAKKILEALGFSVDASIKPWTVTPPSWRRDVEGAADLVEEVARIEGFDKLPEAAPPRAAGLRPPTAGVTESRARVARRALAAAGYQEAVTWSFLPEAQAAMFGLNQEQIARLKLANPIASDLNTMRPTIVANLLKASQRNLDRGFGGADLFEVGPVYTGDGENDQRRAIAAVIQPRPTRHWQGAGAVDLFGLKRDCLMALQAVGAPIASLQSAKADVAWLHPGRGGALRLGPKTVAVFGEVHPRVLAALDVEAPALAFEIDLNAIPAPRAKAGRARPPFEKLDLMPLSRDFAFLVDETTAAADLVGAALKADKTLIADVTLFDVYRGAGVPAGKKSLAIEVLVQPREKTLTEAEIEAVSAKIVAAAAKAVGGVLRG
jgi:phenylalanyl-tRNA synthetase beta chain